MIGKLRSVVLDCPDPRRLAAPQCEPPQFPDTRRSQQFHLDFEVDDVVEAEATVMSLGATRVTDAAGEDHFQVYRDPAGHPFCLVWGVQGAEG